MTAARPRLLSPALIRVFVVSFGAMAGFALLLSVVPVYATTGGAGDAGAGAANAALLLATVGSELATPRLVARWGYRPVLAVALLLLGAPALLLPVSAQLGLIVAVAAARGIGFGIIVVLGSAMVAELVPATRRGEGLGLHGLVIGVPSALGLPFGVYLAGQVGFTPVLVAAGVVVLVTLPAVPGLPARPGGGTVAAALPSGGAAAPGPDAAEPSAASGTDAAGPPGPAPDLGARPATVPPAASSGGTVAAAGTVPVPASASARVSAPVGMVAGLRTPALLRPALVFAASALAAGIVVTFLPLAAPAGGPVDPAAIGLFVMAVTGVVARWWAGRFSDRHGPGRLIVPGLLAASAGMLLLLLVGAPVAMLAGMVLFGLGFGASQNASLVLMFQRVRPHAYGTVSAVWNLAYDGGMGLGALGFGFVVGWTGYPAGFALTGALMLLALLPAYRDRPVARIPNGEGP